MGDIFAETMERRRSSLAGLAFKAKPNIVISLNGDQQTSAVPSYTTLDKIEGVVTITSPVNLPFDDIVITFQGSAKCYVELLAATEHTSARTDAFHNFLRLTQPIRVMDYPPNHVIEAGTVYKFPFTFVVPERLLPQSCTHPRDSQQVHDAHLALPPSLGDPMMSSDGKTLLNDFAPDMTVVTYGVRAIIARRPQEGFTKPRIVADSIKKVRIVPATHEQPPIQVLPNKEDDYVLKKEKHVKKGLFKGKLGKLTMECTQPKPLRLPPLHAVDAPRVTTIAVINLRFHPDDPSHKPPRLGTLATKLKVCTFYASVPMRSLPHRSADFLHEKQRSLFLESLTLSSRNVESATWTPHTRQDSAVSMPPLTTSTSSSSSSPSTFYTAQLLVPVDLPTTTKAFVPTFHSCLLSRVYTLSLTLAAATSTLHLKVPLQIAAAGSPDAAPTISAEEARAIAAREWDADLRPRSTVPLHPDLPSPEYSELPDRQSPAGVVPSPEYSLLPPLGAVGVPSPQEEGRMWAVREGQGAPPGYSVLATGGAGGGGGMMASRQGRGDWTGMGMLRERVG